jgi:hypothetical protein
MSVPSRLGRLGRARWSAWGLAAAVAAVLYGPALNQPFYFDDVTHFYITIKHSFLQIWNNQAGYEYYRPLVFSLYKIIYSFPLPWSLWAGHGLALLLHILCAGLAGELIYSWLLLRPAGVPESLPSRARWLTALLFAVAPAAALTVQYLAALMHLVVALLALIAAWGVTKYLADGRGRWWGLIVCAAVLSPWGHEAGVVVGPLCLLIIAFHDARRVWRNRWRLGAGLVLPSALFMAVWWLVPKSRGGLTWIGWEALRNNVIFFLQGATFPVQPLAVWLGVGDPAWPTLLAASAGLALLAGALWWCRQRRLWSLFWLAVIWAVIGCTPSVLLLPFTYVIGGMRLWYFPLALTTPVWAGAGAAVIDKVRQPALRLGVAAVLVAGLGGYAFIFDWQYIALSEVALAPTRDLAQIARTYPTERHLVINPVGWVSYRAQGYALATTGVPVMPINITLSQLAQANTGLTTWFDGASFPPVRTGMTNYYEGLFAEDRPLDWAGLAALVPQYDRVWLNTFYSDHMAIEEAGSVRPAAAAPPAIYLANLENKVYLLGGGYKLVGKELQMTLQWKYLGPDPDATVFRHVLDCAGNMLGQGDGHVVGRMVPFGLLSPGAEVRDVRHIVLDSSSADGCYQVSVGLYHPNGERLAATTPDGAAFADGVVPITPAAP